MIVSSISPSPRAVGGRAGSKSAHEDAAEEADIIREKAADFGLVGAAEDLDMRPAAGAGPGDDVGGGARQFVGRHSDAAAEGGVVSQERGERADDAAGHRRAVEHANLR